MSAHANLQPETFLSINSLLTPVLNCPVDGEKRNAVFVVMTLTLAVTRQLLRKAPNKTQCPEHSVACFSRTDWISHRSNTDTIPPNHSVSVSFPSFCLSHSITVHVMCLSAALVSVVGCLLQLCNSYFLSFFNSLPEIMLGCEVYTYIWVMQVY